MKKTVIFHIPHDGNEFDEDLMTSVIIDHDRFRWYHNQMRDTDATLFVPENIDAQIVKFHVSRLLCDVERFIGEAEIMEKYGMGFCYERVYDGTIIKAVDDSIKSRTLQLYKKHHQTLDEIVRSASENIVLIDLHSFSKELIVHQPIEKDLPDICIGCESDLPSSTKQLIVSSFLESGFSVDVNFPYQGSMIPNCILSNKVNKKLISFMIEVNKNCYMVDERTNISCVNKIREAIKSIIKAI